MEVKEVMKSNLIIFPFFYDPPSLMQGMDQFKH